MNQMKKVGIIILSYNGDRFLPKCLQSVLKTDYPREDIIFFLVDNASEDGSKAILKKFKEQHSEFNIEIILNKKNLGFAAGNNIGFQHALESSADYMVTLNQDVEEVDPLWIQRLIATLEENPKIAVAQARVMQYPNKTLVNSVGNQFHFLGFCFCEGNGKPFEPKNEGVYEIMYASGCALMTRAALIQKYGGFQEETFMYHDDIELCMKFRLLGYTIAINTDAVVYHEYDFHRSIKKYFWMERNRIWMLLEYYQLRTWFFIFPVFLVMECGILLFSIRRGFFLSKIRGYLDILFPLNLLKIIRRRKYIQSIRRISDRELLRLATPIITDQEFQNPLLKYIANPIMRFYWKKVKNLL